MTHQILERFARIQEKLRALIGKSRPRNEATERFVRSASSANRLLDPAESASRRDEFFVSGGTLPSDAASYIERTADRLLFDSLVSGRYSYVLSPRQMGKSSISIHTIVKLEAAGVRTAFVDLTGMGGKTISAEQWYVGLSLEIARELDLTVEVASYLKANAWLSPIQRFFGALTEIMLPASRQSDESVTPLVVFIDEIDTARSLPFDADDFFAAIRECFNRRVREPEFARLTFCLLGVAVPNDLIRNPAATPFNIGERISLGDFTQEELGAFAHAFGPLGERVMQRVRFWTGGHPFLTQCLCRAIADTGPPADLAIVDQIVEREFFHFKVRDSNINLSDVANIALHYGDSGTNPERFRADLLSAYQRVWAGKHVPDDESNRIAVILKLSGLVKSDGRRLVMRNRIYQHVFDRAWVVENMPGQEVRRQAASFRRGAIRSALVAGAFVALLGSGAIALWQSQQSVVSAKHELDYQLYVSDLRSMPLYFDSGDTGRIETILARHRDSPFRGFECGYWFGQYYDAKEEYTLDYHAPGKREEGFVSADGKEICIVDRLLSIASIVNRANREVVATTPLFRNDLVIENRTGWTIWRYDGETLQLIDLKSNQRRAKVELRIPFSERSVVNGRADYFAFISPAGAAHGAKFIVVRSTVTGKETAVLRVNGLREVLGVSPDGTTILYCADNDAQGHLATNSETMDAEVYNIAEQRIVDRISIPKKVQFLTWSFAGRWALFRENRGSFVGWKIGTHQTFPWTAPVDRGLIDCLPSSDGLRLISWFDGGSCVFADFPSNGNRVDRQNVYTATLGSAPDQFIASSNSVRLYDSSTTTNPLVVARGKRVTRYSADEINLIGFDSSFVRLQEPIDGSSAARAKKVQASQNIYDYTYNGRWFDRLGPGSGQMQLVSSDPSVAPKLFPFVPNIWACGVEAENVAAWDQHKNVLVGFSGKTGMIKWSRTNIDQVNGLWMSPDGARLVMVRRLVDIEVLDAKSGVVIGELGAHNAAPVSICFDSSGKSFFSCGGDGRTLRWDMDSLRKMSEYRGNALDTVTSADISPNQSRVVTSTSAGLWQIWDTRTGDRLLEVRTPAPLTSALFSKSGNQIITAGEDGKVRLWSTLDHDPTHYVKVDRDHLQRIHP